MFFAIKGLKQNGETYINDAIKKGAIAVICSKKCKFNHKKISVIKTSDIRYLLSEVSQNFINLNQKYYRCDRHKRQDVCSRFILSDPFLLVKFQLHL